MSNVSPVFGNNIECVNIVVMIKLQVKMSVQAYYRAALSDLRTCTYNVSTHHANFCRKLDRARAFSYAISVRACVYTRRYTYVASHPPR